jgi:two-component system, sporulation sensor kinase D
MNLYSNKQKWKIVLLIFALVGVGFSLWISNQTVQKVSDRERLRAKQWADAIKKKAELIEFTNRAFLQLRAYERAKMQLYLDATHEISKPIEGDYFPDYSFPMQIINQNKDLPVILIDDKNQVSGYVNLDFDTTELRVNFPSASKKELMKLYEDSLVKVTEVWRKTNKPLSIDVVEGLNMTFYYTDSKKTISLERERDSLINTFNRELILDSKLIPVVLYLPKTDSIIATNLSEKELNNSTRKNTLARLRKINEPLKIKINDETDLELYYDNSTELKQLQYYPYIQFTIIGLFIFIGYLLFSTFRKAEQNQVWAGMAKETAHQMGTPLSSLMAWVQLLEAQNVDQSIVEEMHKDIQRLDTVSQRFSKIGSETQLKDEDINLTVDSVMTYLRPRISQKIEITVDLLKEDVSVRHNRPLMEWVFENICRNAVDAMEAKGKLSVTMHTSPEWLHIDVVDTGKGLSTKQYKQIFKPGITSKKRGWGLGLTLVKRIVEEYHKGKVFVLHSELGKGTTIRVSLPLN